MKFNWGTGIFSFIILFLILCGVFIWFTANKGVNLVHKDYYEKGVDYSEEMKVRERALPFRESFSVMETDNNLVVDFEENLSAHIDSGKIVMFRPSDSNRDVELPLEKQNDKITFNKNQLIAGRYILKITWYSEGKKYELNRPVNVQ